MHTQTIEEQNLVLDAVIAKPIKVKVKTPEQLTKDKISQIKDIVKTVYPYKKFAANAKNPKTVHLKFIDEDNMYPMTQTAVWQEQITTKLAEAGIEYVSALWQTATKQGFGPYQVFYVIIAKQIANQATTH